VNALFFSVIQWILPQGTRVMLSYLAKEDMFVVHKHRVTKHTYL